MDPEYSSPLSKAVLTGVFAGIATTLICLGYDVFYREKTSFALSELINVSSLIFLVNLIFLVFGVVYYFFIRMKVMGNVLYMMCIALLTVLAAVKSASVHRTDDLKANGEFQHLLVVLVLIIGVIGSFGIPLLFNNKKFEEKVM